MPACTRNSCASSRRLRRASASKARSSTSRSTTTSGYIASHQARFGRRARRRPVHRLHGLSRPADRQRAARRLRGLVALAVLRQRGRAADRVRRAGDSLHALDRARSRLAVAHSAAAPRRQRHGVLQPLPRRRCRPSKRCWPTSKARCSPSRASSSSGPGQRRQTWKKQLHRHRPGQRLHRAAGIDQHPPDPARHHPADADVPARRHPPGRHRRIQPADAITRSNTSATSSCCTTT